VTRRTPLKVVLSSEFPSSASARVAECRALMVRCEPAVSTLPRPFLVEQVRRLQDYVATWLPGLDAARPRPVGSTRSVTSDDGFVLERHGPPVVGAGLGHSGFAHAPAVGETIAALATDREPVAARR
jgi:glycine/D-amino acid oxidase-like deaminating enzyme